MKNILYFLFLFSLVAYAGRTDAQNINTIAGTGTAGYSGTNMQAVITELNHPKGTVTDDSGNVYIADCYNNLIRKIDLAGNITTICGYTAGGYGGDGGLATNATLNKPNSIVIDHAGNMYICDADNQRIRKIDTAGIITTVAGNGIAGYNGDGGMADTSEINYPGSIAIDKYGNLYIADEYNNRIRKVDTLGIMTTYAGNGQTGYGGDAGMGDTTALGFPFGVAVDTAGNVYFSLTLNNIVCKVNTAGIISTVAGINSGTGAYSGDGGPAVLAELNNPWGIAVDITGNVYIADNANERIRKINVQTGIISTVAGIGQTGFSGDNGPAIIAKLKDPAGVNVDATGNIYIADYNNHRIRKVSIINHTPYFVNGTLQSLTVCDTAHYSLDSSLAVIDSDNAQLMTWQLVAAPVHGSLVSAYTTFSTGSILTPSGLQYVPANGYSGTDSFRVSISDGINADTATILATVISCSPDETGIVNGQPAQLVIYPNPTDGAFTCNITSPVTEQATIVITNVMGEKVKEYTTMTNEPTSVILSLPEGVYFLTANSAHEKLMGKILVTK